MFVGGEFYYDGEWTAQTSTLSTGGMVFLNGGKACLLVIADYLRDHGVGKILLPAYLCPSILDAFDHCGLDYNFYQVNEDLSIDLDDLAKKAEDYRAVYFINYFGFRQAPQTCELLAELRESGRYVIEDNAQAGFPVHTIGDFVFNSLRKLVPYDGGYLRTPYDLAPYLAKYSSRPNRRLKVIRAYRTGLYRYLVEEVGSHRSLAGLFDRAERYYEEDWAVLGDSQERTSIEGLDWPGIQRARRENYRYLLAQVTAIPGVSVIYPALQEDNLPLGLPVYFNSVSRDAVNDELGEAGIGLTIHWDAISADARMQANHRAVAMAGRMLTLVIDQRTSRKQLDYLALNLVRGIETVKAGTYFSPSL